MRHSIGSSASSIYYYCGRARIGPSTIYELAFIRWINISVGEWPLWRLLPVPLLWLDCSLLISFCPLSLPLPQTSSIMKSQRWYSECCELRVGLRRQDGKDEMTALMAAMTEMTGMTEMAHINVANSGWTAAAWVFKTKRAPFEPWMRGRLPFANCRRDSTAVRAMAYSWIYIY